MEAEQIVWLKVMVNVIHDKETLQNKLLNYALTSFKIFDTFVYS